MYSGGLNTLLSISTTPLDTIPITMGKDYENISIELQNENTLEHSPNISYTRIFKPCQN